MGDLILKPASSGNLKIQSDNATDVLTVGTDGNVIIKPASSGSLKIQDQAGTNFITTGTSSGLTLGTAVTFPSGMPTKFQKTSTTISSAQTLTNSFADITGSSITYTPQTSASYIVYECNFVMTAVDGYNDPLLALRFLVDGTITKNGDSSAPFFHGVSSQYSTPRMGHKMIYSASGWTSDKVVKMQARQYASGTGNSAALHNNHYDYLTSDSSTLGSTDRLTDVEVTIFSVM